MYIYGTNFIYADEDSMKYGVQLCNFDNGGTDTTEEDSNLVLTTNSFKDTWNFYGLEKNSPLQFNLTMAKISGGYFDAHELRALKKWLCKGSMNWLKIEQEDLSSTFYHCIINNPKAISIGGMNAGLQVTVTCDSQVAWSDIMHKDEIFTSVSTNNYLINVVSDFDKYIVRPQLTITCKTNGEIKIQNMNINNDIILTNCINDEIIFLDCNTYKIKSSKRNIMLDNWNKDILTLIEGSNNIKLTGEFDLKINYRLPIRIGG